MTTQTTAITLSTSSYIQNLNGNTVITTGPAVINIYTTGQVLNFANQTGTLDSTGMATGDQSAGIDLSIGNVSGAQARIGNGGGLITGYEYGIFLSAVGTTSNSAFVFNSGTIMSRAPTYGAGKNPDTSGIFAATGTNLTISNGGLIEGVEGIFLESNDPSTQVIINDKNASIIGTVATGQGLFGIQIRDSDSGLQGAGSVANSGLIVGGVEIQAKYGFITNASSGTLMNGVGVFGTGTLVLDAGGTFGGGADFNDGANFGVSLGLASLVLGHDTANVVGTLSNTSNYKGFGSVTITSGADWSVGSAGSTAGFATVTTISDFGTLNVAGQLSGNTIDMEGSVAGASSVVDFTGSNSATPLTDFSTNDEIIVATLASAAGNNYKDSYSAGVLTVTEFNAAGTSIGSEVITVSGTTAAALSAGSFVNIGGPGGDTIVLGSTSLANTGSIYIDNGESVTLSNTSGVDTIPVTFGARGTSLALNTLDLNGTFSGAITGFGLNDDIVLGASVLPSQILGGQDVLSYSGGLLTVTELNASGTTIGTTTLNVGAGYSTGSFLALFGTNGVNIETPATVDEKPLTFNATGTANIETVTDYSGGLAPGSSLVTGETLIIASGTAAVSTTAPITNSGTILVSGASSAFLDAGTLSGTGTVIAAAGATVTLANASNAVDFGATSASGLNMLDLTGSATAFTGAIGGFGTGDDIVIGPSALPGDTTIGASIGASVSLAYSGSLLTVTELNSGGTAIGSVTLNVGTGYAANSFVALYGTNGINIETPQTVNEQSFTFVGNGSSVPDFTDPLAYAGGLSPGDSIITGEVVTVQSAPTVKVAIEGPEVNNGTILINGSQVLDAASSTGGSDLTGNGTVAITNGGFFQQNGGSTSNTIAFGANTTAVISQLTLNDSVSSFASPILGFGTNDEIFLASNVLPAPSAGVSLSDSYNSGTGILVISETNATGTVVATATLDVASGGSLSASSFVLVSTANGVRVFTGGTQLSTNNGNLLANTSGSIVIDHGQQVTLANTTGVDNLPVTFGTNGASLALNVLDLNGTVSGTNSPYQGTISGFGLNDDIILGPSVLPSQILGGQDVLSYSGSLLSVTEFNASGVSIGSTTIDVGTGYSTGSFLALLGSNGVNIETPATVDEMPLTFNASGTANIETTTDYAGGLAPGSSIVTGETVIIASGTAAVSTTAPITNSGTILVSGASSGFLDAGTLSGNGTIIAAAGGTVTLASASNTVDFGAASAGTLNVLDLTGSPAGFSGTIGGFGVNDDIVLGPSVLPSVATGDTVTLSYSGSLLTVTELNSGGTAIGSTTLNVGTGYAAGSFVALLGTNGVNIETPQTVDEQNFVFGPLTGATNYQGDFENPADYQGGLAPGATIVAGETVTVQEPAQANVTTALTNNGLIVLDALNSNMDATAAISGTGTIDVGGGSNLVLANSVGSTTDTIAFTGAGLLDLAGTGTASFTGTITGEDQTDTIEIGGSFLPTPSNASAVSLSFNTASGVLSIFDTVGGTVYTDMLHFAGPVSNNFSAAVSGGNIVISDVPCFAAGTRILTVWGSRKVEELAIGDEVFSARDGRSRKIIWVGRRTVDLSRHANPDKVIPVLIAAGAFGEGLPERDLRVSPDHALYIDGHLIEAKTLVNGATIIRDRAARLVTYHHIELETHDVVLAEGLPAETYLDSGNRRNFESGAGPLALHPDFAAASRAGACAELLLDGEIVRHARQALLDRAAELGFRRTNAIDLVARIDGEVITPYADDSGRELMFVLPAGARAVTLLSSAGVPAETSADPGDRRVLGAAIRGLALIVGGKRIEIDLNAAHAGFHDAEEGQRWTNGKATIALPAYAGRAVLEATLGGQAARWLAPVAMREFANV